MKIKYTTLAIVVVIVTAFFISVPDKNKVPVNDVSPKLTQEMLSPMKTISDSINSLPDGSLKSNMSAVLGAEYADSSDELNEILQMYAIMKLDELQKQKQNYGKQPTDL